MHFISIIMVGTNCGIGCNVYGQWYLKYIIMAGR